MKTCSVYSILALLLLAATCATADAASREYPVSVQPDLIAHGIQATKANVAAESQQDSEAPACIVFITFAKAFQGELFVSGFRKDGTEVARSALLRVSEKADAGGNIRFVFDKYTKLGEVTSFSLGGTAKPVPAPKKQESAGEAAKNIVKELLQ